MTEWTKDPYCQVAFDEMMLSTKPAVMKFLNSLKPYFDNTPNMVLMRILGYTLHHFTLCKEANDNWEDTFQALIQEVMRNPELAKLMHMGGVNMVNAGVGV